ncbi:MAG: hypothetical protein J3K34DRAFT_10354 [Monoraphidium minutum]|nr:MAG: hypothetical protein J3K34DRAFT_10354 [Monoraphidium minutum]
MHVALPPKTCTRRQPTNSKQQASRHRARPGRAPAKALPPGARAWVGCTKGARCAVVTQPPPGPSSHFRIEMMAILWLPVFCPNSVQTGFAGAYQGVAHRNKSGARPAGPPGRWAAARAASVVQQHVAPNRRQRISKGARQHQMGVPQHVGQGPLSISVGPYVGGWCVNAPLKGRLKGRLANGPGARATTATKRGRPGRGGPDENERTKSTRSDAAHKCINA